jgi:hypothetical protein
MLHLARGNTKLKEGDATRLETKKSLGSAITLALTVQKHTTQAPNFILWFWHQILQNATPQDATPIDQRRKVPVIREDTPDMYIRSIAPVVRIGNREYNVYDRLRNSPDLYWDDSSDPPQQNQIDYVKEYQHRHENGTTRRWKSDQVWIYHGSPLMECLHWQCMKMVFGKDRVVRGFQGLSTAPYTPDESINAWSRLTKFDGSIDTCSHVQDYTDLLGRRFNPRAAGGVYIPMEKDIPVFELYSGWYGPWPKLPREAAVNLLCDTIGIGPGGGGADRLALSLSQIIQVTRSKKAVFTNPNATGLEEALGKRVTLFVKKLTEMVESALFQSHVVALLRNPPDQVDQVVWKAMLDIVACHGNCGQDLDQSAEKGGARRTGNFPASDRSMDLDTWFETQPLGAKANGAMVELWWRMRLNVPRNARATDGMSAHEAFFLKNRKYSDGALHLTHILTALDVALRAAPTPTMATGALLQNTIKVDSAQPEDHGTNDIHELYADRLKTEPDATLFDEYTNLLVNRKQVYKAAPACKVMMEYLYARRRSSLVRPATPSLRDRDIPLLYSLARLRIYKQNDEAVLHDLSFTSQPSMKAIWEMLVDVLYGSSGRVTTTYARNYMALALASVAASLNRSFGVARETNVVGKRPVLFKGFLSKPSAHTCDGHLALNFQPVLNQNRLVQSLKYISNLPWRVANSATANTIGSRYGDTLDDIKAAQVVNDPTQTRKPFDIYALEEAIDDVGDPSGYETWDEIPSIVRPWVYELLTNVRERVVSTGNTTSTPAIVVFGTGGVGHPDLYLGLYDST